MKNSSKFILICGGVDPTGNAGILRDSAVATDLRTHFHTAVTAITAQTDEKYFDHQLTSVRAFKKMLPASRPDVIKIGMLGSLSLAKQLATYVGAFSQKPRVVWDPVFRSSSGGILLPARQIRTTLSVLSPLVDVVTPNAEEAAWFGGISPNNPLIQQAKCLQKKSQLNFYLKGGHTAHPAWDLWVTPQAQMWLKGKKCKLSLRGTGCALATAYSCFLGKGADFTEAALLTKEYMNGFFQSFKIFRGRRPSRQ